MKEDIRKIVEEGWELLNGGDRDRAEQLFIVASEQAPDATDPWNGLGAAYFEAGDLATSLRYYMKARENELARRGGKWPDRLEWDGEDRPALRALHGIGLNLFRLGRGEEAEKVFRELLELNPNDNQGVRYLLDDIERGKTPWDGSSDDE